jgi:hypothetical protein
MQTLLLLSLLSQVIAPQAGATPVERPPYTWSDGHRSYKLWESMQLVAEPGPTEARKEVLLEQGAVLVVDRPTMRVWKVADARAARLQFAELRPVFHDVPALVGRFRVPMGLICHGQRVDAGWLEVLHRSDGACLPDFWYPPVLK